MLAPCGSDTLGFRSHNQRLYRHHPSSLSSSLIFFLFFFVFKQLPLGILKATESRPTLVELKDGETLNGHLVSCDGWMNLILKEVIQTSADGETFWRLPEVYVRGNHVRLRFCSLFPLSFRNWSRDTYSIGNLSILITTPSF